MGSSTKYPLRSLRKLQFLLSAASFPCALAAIVKTHGAPESILQLIFLTASGISALVNIRDKRKLQELQRRYTAFQILADFIICAALIGIYIIGMVIIATREVRHWRFSDDSKLIHGVPQIYSNLFCLLLGLLHWHALIKQLFYRYLEHKLKKNPKVPYVMCPSCEQSEKAIAIHGLSWVRHSQRGVASSIADLQESYTDNKVESRPFLYQQDKGTVTIDVRDMTTADLARAEEV
ncbi:uncharacterized protein N7459_004461 [Penicillium hispanicum]|uniref:uncharacterized protein n=1 Tax=Penicillium hispanicum TaxID=1080232 RepID=UPI002540321D|nr:uncharacterized protein N7459_004461 [Penicillium hispanicum]KAJ5584661.1 hypothetical protein N7459_004461 [Penicillium hispanicum]